jgi:signal transduction histidine kinase
VKHSLRTRLILTHLGVAALAIVLVALIAAVTAERRFAAYTRDAQADAVAALVAAVTDTGTDDWSSSEIQSLRRLAKLNSLHFALFDPDGALLFSSAGAGRGGPHGGGLGRSSEPPAAGWSVRSEKILVNGHHVAELVLQQPQARQLPANIAYRRDIFLYLALAGGLAALTSLAVGALVSRRITRPLEHLSAATTAIARGSRTVRVDVAGEDEVGTLATSFNVMSDALERQAHWRRTMTADLAHELRTPLATIQSRVEALEDGVLPTTPDNLRVIGQEVERLDRLLTMLRSLDDLDIGIVPVHREHLDLANLAAGVVEASRERFRQKDLHLRASLQPVPVEGDPDKLTQVLVNLLDNAHKFTPAGGTVLVRTEHQGSGPHAKAFLLVTDSGPGIPEEDIPQVFERFFRGRHTAASEGVGLGLAIVRRIVEAHEGSVEVTSGEGGTTFVVALPLVRAPSS